MFTFNAILIVISFSLLLLYVRIHNIFLHFDSTFMWDRQILKTLEKLVIFVMLHCLLTMYILKMALSNK